jgi:papain like protease
MPIRMEDDPVDPQESGGGNDGGGGSGGGGGLFQLLPLLLLLFRSPKILLLLVILGAGYFFFGRGCNLGSLQNVAQLATGGILDPRQFDKAKIYEPLSEDNSKNPLPESANLQKYAPAVGDQGQQGSCVAWSSAYGARTIVEAVRTGKDPNSLKFSPSFLYNQIGVEGCEGALIQNAMQFMIQRGAVPYDQFAYSDQDCSKQPDRQLLDEAQQFKMRGANRLTVGDRTDAIDLRAIKENLAQGAPVVIGMMVGGSYMQPMMGQDAWTPTQDDYSMQGFGGHAQCVVGYDDAKNGGSFLIMNSWGSKWGNNGFAWVRYTDFKTFVREAYGLESMGSAANANASFECEIGLVQVTVNGTKVITGSYIPLKNPSSNIFETTSTMRPGTKFKMEVKNSTECYIYVFGKETDGTSYTLFPYPSKDDPTTTKYSPFCGIAGYRLFPNDKSMKADSIGNKDFIAVVVSKDSLNWNAINQQISQNPQQDYASRLNSVLTDKLIRSVHFDATAKGNMHFKVDGTGNGAVACIVEIDK